MKLTSYSIANNIEIIHTLAQTYFGDNSVLEELVVCQAILEGALKKMPPSTLALEANNVFGLKFNRQHSLMLPMAKKLTTKEFVIGNWRIWRDSFAAFNSLEDCFTTLAEIYTLPKYSKLHDKSQNLSFREAAQVLVDAHYATDPKYVAKLVRIYGEFFD